MTHTATPKGDLVDVLVTGRRPVENALQRGLVDHIFTK